MPLSKSEREEFLSEPHIAALSVFAGNDRGPLTVPIWYQYSPGGEAWLLTGKNSKKAELIRAAGRFSLMVEQVEPTIKYVAVDGPVTREEPGTLDQLREMAARYLAPEKVEGYLQFAASDHGDQTLFALRIEHWLGADLGAI
ncbi:pyridoxamine 5'-phosphate oxidase family protein [Rhodococcus sp. P1Y]|uniref:pyridoxamine 5'-phosphate oxidase family protein n=1 Tax=Rhodococcus sp. P1Y TaxID=1302308 RepID=UPI000EAD5952|nr:pyridoxamine 5'-phosphate oxidase family protein [Rhodococcus sp. P1Y]AYJ47612.1 pyridoxamine 5'-phosphate oxidase family protein [Rhodococcus sp. P1Y]